MGLEVDPLNTVQFSNHRWTGLRFGENHIAELFDGLADNDLIKGISHILTGYVGKERTLAKIASFIQDVQKVVPRLKILIDPVLGDNQQLYCPAECIPIYQDMLQLADIITPNGSEAEWLSDMDLEDDGIEKIIQKLHTMGPSQVIVTSVPRGKELYLY
ncbi:hypothetical protein HDU91_002966, partial [Kappamyces sp. JEL0680]